MKRRNFLKLAAMMPLGVAGVPAMTAEPAAVLNEGRTELPADGFVFAKYEFLSTEEWFRRTFPVWEGFDSVSRNYPPQYWEEYPR